jgi:ankyrin repeat protein
MFAAQNNHTEIVQELIKAGAIVNLKSDRHETALLLAH